MNPAVKALKSSAVLLGITLFSGCASTPKFVSYNGEQVPAVSVLSITCSKPYELSQDCSSLSGGKLRVNLGGYELKAAGSENGDVVLLMATGLTFKSDELRIAGSELEQLASDAGFNVLERKVGAHGDAIGALLIVFDGDVYSLLKDRAVQ